MVETAVGSWDEVGAATAPADSDCWISTAASDNSGVGVEGMGLFAGSFETVADESDKSSPGSLVEGVGVDIGSDEVAVSPCIEFGSSPQLIVFAGSGVVDSGDLPSQSMIDGVGVGTGSSEVVASS